MLAKKIEIPISLKVSYKSQLQLKLSVPQKFQIQKFARHWIIMAGFYEYQEQQLTKRYFSYLNEGDLVKIKGNYVKADWKEKNVRKFDNTNEIQKFFNLQFQSNHKISQKKYIKQNTQHKILRNLTKFYEEEIKKQMDGLKVISLFLNMNSDNPFIIELLDFIKSQNNSNVFVSIFVNDIFFLHENHYNFIDKWVFFHSISNIESQLKFFFFKLSKITVKKIILSLKCFDGEMHKRNLKSKKEKKTDWILENNKLCYELNYPQCNKIYINTIQLRNLGYQQSYKFELCLECMDINDQIFHSTKTFQLKPQREEFESIRSPDYNAENESKIKEVFQIQQSLKCDCVQIFDKLEDLKQVCEKIQIQIKNNTNFPATNDEDQDKMKMLHSFQI